MTDPQFLELMLVLERIAFALEGPIAPAPVAESDPAPTVCLHPEKSRVKFGSDDEWECTALFNGRRCGFRSPALIASGG